MSTLPEHLRGDGPCKDCGTADNIVWFTDNVLWNEVVGGLGTMDDPGGLLCIPCFVKRTDATRLWPSAWRLLPEWHWETVEERDARKRYRCDRCHDTMHARFRKSHEAICAAVGDDHAREVERLLGEVQP